MVTSHHPEVAAGVRKFALLDVFHPGAKNAQRHLVFLLTRHRAGVASDTSILVYNESVSHASELDIVLEGATGECQGRPALVKSLAANFLGCRGNHPAIIHEFAATSVPANRAGATSGSQLVQHD